MRQILTNKAKCNNCGDVIESKHQHDFVACSCFADTLGTRGIAIDGGKTSLKRSGTLDPYTELSTFGEKQ